MGQLTKINFDDHSKDKFDFTVDRVGLEAVIALEVHNMDEVDTEHGICHTFKKFLRVL